MREYSITIRFYEELNDFLPAQMRKRDIDFSYSGKRSVKDLIECFGVPHVEVDLILVNGESVDFSYIIEDKDRISVYPVFESLNIKGATHLRPSPLRDTKFVLDVHLRKLARRLRLLGFDIDYEDKRDDDVLAEISSAENRILLTRDRQLLMRKIVSRGLIVRNTDPDKQVVEILERLDLWDRCSPFARCIECNGFIRRLMPDHNTYTEMMSRVPPGVAAWCEEYYYCSGCAKVYWRGSHYEKLMSLVNNAMRDANKGS